MLCDLIRKAVAPTRSAPKGRPRKSKHYVRFFLRHLVIDKKMFDVNASRSQYIEPLFSGLHGGRTRNPHLVADPTIL